MIINLAEKIIKTGTQFIFSDPLPKFLLRD